MLYHHLYTSWSIRGLLGGQVVKELDYIIFIQPERSPHHSNTAFFHLGVHSALPQKVSRSILKVFSSDIFFGELGIHKFLSVYLFLLPLGVANEGLEKARAYLNRVPWD